MSQQDAPGAGAEVAQADAHAPDGPQGVSGDVPADGADEAMSSLIAPMVSRSLAPVWWVGVVPESLGPPECLGLRFSRDPARVSTEGAWQADIPRQCSTLKAFSL